jgi:hypothetical protein
VADLRGWRLWPPLTSLYKVTVELGLDRVDFRAYLVKSGATLRQQRFAFGVRNIFSKAYDVIRVTPEFESRREPILPRPQSLSDFVLAPLCDPCKAIEALLF